MPKSKRGYQSYFKVGKKWQHLDSPIFHKAAAAADYAGRFYLTLKWKILRVNA